MTEAIIVCQGLAGYTYRDQPQKALVGQYLAAYDPEAHDGMGEAEWTTNPDLAMRFPNQVAALECWRTVPASRPLRPDGKPNRPLCAFTVEVRDAP
jgi:hypothetical protein